MGLTQRQLDQQRNTESGQVAARSDTRSSRPADSNVLVSYGTHHTPFPIRGLTVGQARESLTRLMNIDETAVAVVNGAPVEDDTMIDQRVTLLSFVKPASIRGACV
jgi:hypothetical protein